MGKKQAQEGLAQVYVRAQTTAEKKAFEERSLPQWSEIPALKKSKRIPKLVEERQSLLKTIKMNKIVVEDIDSELGSIFDMNDVKSCLVDDFRVTRVEASPNTTFDKKALVSELLDRGVGIDVINEAMAAATKPGKGRSAHMQVKSLSGGDGEGEE